MKNKRLIITAAALLAVIVLAAALYPVLSEAYLKDEAASGLGGDADGGKKDVSGQNDVSGEKNDGTADGGKSESQPALSENLTDDFTVYDADMNGVRLSDFFGKPIFVNFWASWCSPCRSELPAFDSVYRKYKDEVVFLMVNLADGDTPSGIEKFVADNGYAFPVYYDIAADAAEAYGVYSIPETLFINADGSLYRTQLGAVSEAVLENYVKALLK